MPLGLPAYFFFFLAINNLRTQKPNQNKKIQPVSFGVGGGRLFKLLAFPGPRRWSWAQVGTVTGTCASPRAAGTAGT